LTNEFFVKNRRAQNDDDYESWASTTVAATLNGFDNTGSVRATTLIIFYGNRVDDVRFQKDVINTLQARMGTGGNNMPMVLIEETDMQKDQNIVGTLQARDYKGVGNQYVEENKLVVAYDEYNDTVAETHQTLRAGTKQSTGVIESLAFHIKQTPVSGAVSPALGTTSEGMGYMSAKSTVRRLTPTECERLQGFPDGWTEGQSDSSRYKQMGNAVAVPVVEWLIGRLVTEHMES
jgi:site-specific DNA-cytosine methylase